jgi:hypothetical protein
MIQTSSLFEWFTGVDGHTYYFRTKAVDTAGNQESYPIIGDTSTIIQLPSVIGWIDGHVFINGSSTPIVGANVSVSGGPSTFTDASGHYNLSVIAGNHIVTANMSGYYDETENAAVTVDHATPVDFNLVEVPTIGWLEGRVLLLGTSTPISGATISVGASGSGLTDSAGYYNISIDPGWHDATASKSGYSSVVVPLTIVVRKTTTQNFYLDTLPTQGTIEGYVLDIDTNTAIAGATVQIQGGASTITDSNGYYSITATPGTAQVAVDKTGYDPGTKSVSVNAGQVTTRDFHISLSPSADDPTPSTFGTDLSEYWWALLFLIVILLIIIIILLFSRRKEKPDSEGVGDEVDKEPIEGSEAPNEVHDEEFDEFDEEFNEFDGEFEE